MQFKIRDIKIISGLRMRSLCLNIKTFEMKINASINVAALLSLVIMMASCKKEDKVQTAPTQAHFTNQSSGTYIISAPGVTYKVPVGVTTVSSAPRTINVTITSPTGAQQGTHYTAPTSIVIPAGKAVDSLVIAGVYNQYTNGRRDTLIITLQDADLKASSYNSKFTLIVRGPCAETDIVLAEFMGDYANTTETWGTSGYGPYQTSITAVNQTSATTGTITVSNIFDSGWDPLVFTLDWTDPAHRKITVAQQVAGGNAGVNFGPAFDGQPYAVRSVPASLGGDVGTFSYCHQTLVLKMLIGIAGVGFDSDIYTVNMAR
jgi:hypothetical protein